MSHHIEFQKVFQNLAKKAKFAKFMILKIVFFFP